MQQCKGFLRIQTLKLISQSHQGVFQVIIYSTHLEALRGFLPVFLFDLVKYRGSMIFTLDELSRLLGTCFGPVQDGFHFRMGFGPVSNHILFRTP